MFLSVFGAVNLGHENDKLQCKQWHVFWFGDVGNQSHIHHILMIFTYHNMRCVIGDLIAHLYHIPGNTGDFCELTAVIENISRYFAHKWVGSTCCWSDTVALILLKCAWHSPPPPTPLHTHSAHNIDLRKENITEITVSVYGWNALIFCSTFNKVLLWIDMNITKTSNYSHYIIVCKIWTMLKCWKNQVQDNNIITDSFVSNLTNLQ